MLKQFEQTEQFLKEYLISYKKDYVIKYDTYFKMGGSVKLFITPNEINQFKVLINFLNGNNINFKIIGFTSNIIMLDELEYSIIISTIRLAKLTVNNEIIEVESGYSLQDLVRVAVMHQGQGYEGLEGIPASIGGAIVMNAGAYGDTISDNLISVEYLDENNKLIILNKKECNFNYRNSLFKENQKYTILRAKFRLIKGDRDEIQKKIEVFHLARHSYQDFVYPNLGSMISLTGDSYYKIINKSIKYNIVYWILKYIYKNPVTKFINRKKANNIVFNKLLLKYLNNEKNIHFKYTLSTKSANILINDGSVDSKEIINYIYLFHDLIGKKFHIENEIVLEPIFLIQNEFKETYEYLKEQRKRRK